MDVLGAHSYDTLVELERERNIMRRSSINGGAFSLMVTRLSSDSFLETLPLCSTLHLIGTF